MTYELEFNVFVSNVNLLARTFNYYLTLLSESDNNHQILAAINRHPQFWIDYNYSSLSLVFIILGRIFDDGKNSHGVKKLLGEIKKTGHFTKQNLRSRKLKLSKNGCVDWDVYISKAHELDADDINNIESIVEQARDVWNSMLKIRNKLVAHEDILDDSIKLAIMKTSDNEKLAAIIQRLLNLVHILEELGNNGTKPDFSYQSQWEINKAKNEAKSFLYSLLNV